MAIGKFKSYDKQVLKYPIHMSTCIIALLILWYEKVKSHEVEFLIFHTTVSVMALSLNQKKIS